MPKVASIKNVIFLGRKDSAVPALEYLLSKKIKVKLIVAPEKEEYPLTLRAAAKKYRIPFLSDDRRLYDWIIKRHPLTRDIDLVISFLFWKKIKDSLIKLARVGCVNFHPAPLPDYKGRAGYNTAILEQKKTFGVSAHFIDSENFDSGPIIKVLRFPFDPQKETAFSLERKTQIKLIQLFKEVINLLRSKDKLTLFKNEGGLYLNKEQLENLKFVDLEHDKLEDIDRKIRAFFFPPYHGAKIKVRGAEFTLLNEEMLNLIYKLIKGHE
ncbi:MAG: formyltransferase family protein [Patescibacteria group bacterium]|nr:formyltransferase family protein [Patescibacteria group bacterium]